MKRLATLVIALSGLIGAMVHSEVLNELKLIARTLEGTIFVTPMNQYSEAVVDACGFEFKALAFDNIYKGGAPFILTGSFAIRQFNNETLFLAYKVGTGSWTGNELKPEAPNMAWIKFGDQVFKSKIISDSEDDGHKLYVVELSDKFYKIIPVISNQQQVIVGFNRREGGLDVVVPLDLNVRDTNLVKDKAIRKKDKTIGTEFNKCFGDLLKVVRK
jgi:hypothetical protein